MSEPALAFRDVEVRYEPGAKATLAGLSFEIAAGQRVALLGLNGSGKTTLLMAAVGLVPHSGEIRIGGVVLQRSSLRSIRDQVGFLFNVPEDQLVFPKVIDDVAFGLLRKGMAPSSAAAKALRALEALGVGHLAESPVHSLSHGQKQRVALAGALAVEPRLILLDEPSAALDPPARHALARLLSGLDAAMIVATHDLGFAASVCNRFLVLEEGRIAYDGVDPAQALGRWGLAGEGG